MTVPLDAEAPAHVVEARRWIVEGRVQGVGFRPFVYRLAHAHGLTGTVQNRGGVVHIAGQGMREVLDAFERALVREAPPFAQPRIASVEVVATPIETTFRIVESAREVSAQIHVPPDQFACDECLAEMRNPDARRYRYPFINCTQCGPRYTIIRALPYDRPNTTMAGFPLCPACNREYHDPLDRRFHAQPLACPACGPQLHWHCGELRVGGSAEALNAAITALRAGLVVAVRGIGGYHLVCDAANEVAVTTLRHRKHRPDKPFALMIPQRGADRLDAARELAELDPAQAAALTDPQRPIVLVTRRANARVAPAVAPGLRELGLMLPYSPLHHLLLDDFGSALVATSGNVSGEPVLTDPDEAEARLAGVADAFLHHDRPIQRPADDAVVQFNAGRVRPLRIGRGNGPLELELPRAIAQPTLAVGAFLKNTVALAWERRIVISPHLGELQSPRSRAVLQQAVADLQKLYGVQAQRIACDAHPDFPNSRWAREQGLPLIKVLHHHAHASALAGEFALEDPMLCFTWDGVGCGERGELWGGEGFYGAPGAWHRVTSFRTFRLPGGDRATLEPWRTGLSLCWTTGRTAPAGLKPQDPLMRPMFDRGIAAPATSAVGRLFDGIAALGGLCHFASHEGEAPMHLEALCGARADALGLPLARDRHGIWRSDWAPLVDRMLDSHRDLADRASAFHAELARALVDQADAVRAERSFTHVGLTGGVFQNRTLTALAQDALTRAGYQVLIPERIPVNDAGISYGQIIEAVARKEAS